MAMGRQKDGQGDLMVSWSEMPRSPGHVFYDRLQSVLVEGGFDAFAEASCRPYYAARMGAPSVPPGRYFRMHLVGYFEGIDSERGLEWRCSDSLSLRAFLRLGSRDRVPDHSWLSRSRTRLPHEVHAAVFDWGAPYGEGGGAARVPCIDGFDHHVGAKPPGLHRIGGGIAAQVNFRQHNDWRRTRFPRQRDVAFEPRQIKVRVARRNDEHDVHIGRDQLHRTAGSGRLAFQKAFTLQAANDSLRGPVEKQPVADRDAVLVRIVGPGGWRNGHFGPMATHQQLAAALAQHPGGNDVRPFFRRHLCLKVRRPAEICKGHGGTV